MTWRYDGKEHVCKGSFVQYGDGPAYSAQVHETPREVLELMRSAKEDMIELHHHGDPTVPVYIVRGHIIAVNPSWTIPENP